MSNELTNTTAHLRNETMRLIEAVVLKDMEAAEQIVGTIINLIHHAKRIEARDDCPGAR